MRECFVIMPIGSGDAYKVYRNRYEHIIKPAIESLIVNEQKAFNSVRADFVTKSGSITRDLLGRLYRSDAVIADLTDLNPNVFYELGVRHALRSGTILIALKGTKPPFDVGDLRVISYEDCLGGEKDAIPQIQEILRSLLGEVRQQDSPVLHAIPELAELGAVKEHEARFSALQRERDLLKAQLEVLEKTSLTNQAALEAMREAIEGIGKQLSESQRKSAQENLELLVKEKQAAVPSITLPGLGSVEVEPETIFILMPFSKDMEPIFHVITDAAQEVGLKCYRADSTMTPGSIIDQIFENIAKAGLIVADISGRNQNVIYELGVANAMGKKTLLLSQDRKNLPFDLQHQRVLLYESSSTTDYEIFKCRLVDFFKQYQMSGNT